MAYEQFTEQAFNRKSVTLIQRADKAKFDAARAIEAANERDLFRIIDKYPTIKAWFDQIDRRTA
jgi:hypothetical protein